MGGIEDKIPDVWRKNFNFSPTKRDGRGGARAGFQSRIRCIGFGDGGLMHTSHLVNARRKTDRRRRGV